MPKNCEKRIRTAIKYLWKSFIEEDKAHTACRLHGIKRYQNCSCHSRITLSRFYLSSGGLYKGVKHGLSADVVADFLKKLPLTTKEFWGA